MAAALIKFLDMNIMLVIHQSLIEGYCTHKQSWYGWEFFNSGMNTLIVWSDGILLSKILISKLQQVLEGNFCTEVYRTLFTLFNVKRRCLCCCDDKYDLDLIFFIHSALSLVVASLWRELFYRFQLDFPNIVLHFQMLWLFPKYRWTWLFRGSLSVPTSV